MTQTVISELFIPNNLKVAFKSLMSKLLIGSFLDTSSLQVNWSHRLWLRVNLHYFSVCLLSFPDWREKSLGRRLQRHKLCVSGQPAICPDLLGGGLLRPVGPHGPGLPTYLRHCHDTCEADRDITAGRLCSSHQYGSDDHCKVLYFFRSTRTLPPQDNNRLLL